MKWVMFWEGERRRLAAWIGDSLVVSDDPHIPGMMEQLIAGGPDIWAAVEKSFRADGVRKMDPRTVRLAAPLTRPGKIMAIGLNYLDHCREQNVPVPKSPMVFTKFVTAINDPGGPISWDPALTDQVDFEAELAVVIGKRARRVSKADALSYVFGYTAVNDVTARDLQNSDRQWVRSKSLDTFCPMGPAVVTADEIPDPQKLAVRSRVNGVLMQDSSTAEMVFGVAELVSFLSMAFTLEPGDVIATGTPDGVGVFRKPPVFLKHGDTVQIEVEKIGVLENPVRLDNPA